MPESDYLKRSEIPEDSYLYEDEWYAAIEVETWEEVYSDYVEK